MIKVNKYIDILFLLIFGAFLIRLNYKFIEAGNIFSLGYLIFFGWLIVFLLKIFNPEKFKYLVILVFAIGTINFSMQYNTGFLGSSVIYSLTIEDTIVVILVVYIITKLIIKYTIKHRGYT